jgi:DNA-binding HxlR family transcriptional regulator
MASLTVGAESCPFQGMLELLGRRHMLSILWVLQQHSPRRFTEIKRAMGLNPVTLTERLSELDRAGIVRRTAYGEIPPRVDYALTERGRELLVILDALEGWSKDHPGALSKMKTGRTTGTLMRNAQ